MRFGRLVPALTVVLTLGLTAPADAVAAGPATRGYLADNADGSLVVFDPASGTITNRIALGFRFGRIAVRPDGAEVYVSDWGSAGDTVVVVDTATHTIVDRINVGPRPSHLAFTPDSRRLYIANDSANTLQVLDTATRQVVKTIPLADDPADVEVSPDGTRVFLGTAENQQPFGSDVVVFSTATNTIIDTIPLPSRDIPNDVTFSPNGRLVVVSSGELIDTTTNTVSGSVPRGGDYEFTADSARIYVANGCGGPERRGSLQLADVATGAVVRTVLTSGSPNDLAMAPDRGRLYVELFNDGGVAVVNTANDQVVDRFGVAGEDHGAELRGIEVSGAVPAGGPGERFALRTSPFNLCDL